MLDALTVRLQMQGTQWHTDQEQLTWRLQTSTLKLSRTAFKLVQIGPDHDHG